jgi:hypothetical protein
VLAVYQAALDVMHGLSIQLDVCRYPAHAALQPLSPFVGWMGIDPRHRLPPLDGCGGMLSYWGCRILPADGAHRCRSRTTAARASVRLVRPRESAHGG